MAMVGVITLVVITRLEVVKVVEYGCIFFFSFYLMIPFKVFFSNKKSIMFDNLVYI